jgi:hypothetical protein
MSDTNVIVIALNTGNEPFRIYRCALKYFSIEGLNRTILDKKLKPSAWEQHLQYVLHDIGYNFRVVKRVRKFSERLLPQIKISEVLGIPWINEHGKILI